VIVIGFILVVIFRKDYDVEHTPLRAFAYLHELQSEAKKDPLRKEAISSSVNACLAILLLFLQYCICYASLDPMIFQLHESVLNHLKYADIESVSNTVDQMYSALNDSFLQSVFPKSGSKLISDGCGYRLSRVSVRQLRRRRKPVSVGLVSDRDKDETRCFAPGWTELTPCNLTNGELLAQAFMNRVDGAGYSGQLAEYRGGGFSILLPDSLEQSRALIGELKSLNWLDRHTRFVAIDLDLLYSDINLFTSVTLAVELQPFGGALVSHQLLSTRLYRYVGAMGVFALVSEILAGIIVLIRLVLLLLRLRKFRDFWNSFENWLDVGVALSMTATASIYGVRTANTGAALEAAVNGGRPQLRALLLLNQYFYYCLGAGTFMLQLSLLGLVRFSTNLSHLLATLRLSLSQMRSFSIVFCVIFVAFSLLMNLLLGSVQQQFNSPAGTMSTLFTAMLGKFDIQIVTHHGLLPKIAFSIYVSFLTFVIVNFFVSVLNESYEMSKNCEVAGARDFQIVQFILQRFKNTFWNRAQESRMWILT
uniref:PKD_channel domain-containing protein n=1 Tax=Macrostomum lignano TaxID=282301 RepID=A0A1I8GYK7_9PLAT